MLIRCRNIGLFLVSGLSFLASAVIAAPARQCIDCTPAQMLSLVRTLGPGNYLVWNPANGEVRRYASYCGQPNRADPVMSQTAPTAESSGGQRGCSPLTTEDIPVSAESQQMAQALSQIWLHLGRTFQRRGAVTVYLSQHTFAAYPLNPPTAHNFLSDFNLRGQIADIVSRPDSFQMSGSAIAGPLAYVAAHVDAMVSYTEGVQLEVEVVFIDGSKVVFHSILGRQAQYIAGSGRDSTGHILPEGNSSNWAGQWVYDAVQQRADLGRFLELLHGLGIASQGASGTSTRTLVRCSWSSQTHQLTCYIGS